MTKGVSGIDGSEGDDGEEGDKLREGVAGEKASLLGRARFNDVTLLCTTGVETGVVQPETDWDEATENDGSGSEEEGAAVDDSTAMLTLFSK